jgi:YggT family protein
VRATKGFTPGDLRQMGGFIVPVIEVVIAILNIYWWLVIIQAVVSWLIAFNIINTYSRPVAMVLDFLYRITEPVLRPIRQFIPTMNGLDLSPLLLLLVIWFAEMELGQLEVFMLTH